MTLPSTNLVCHITQVERGQSVTRKATRRRQGAQLLPSPRHGRHGKARASRYEPHAHPWPRPSSSKGSLEGPLSSRTRIAINTSAPFASLEAAHSNASILKPRCVPPPPLPLPSPPTHTSPQLLSSSLQNTPSTLPCHRRDELKPRGLPFGRFTTRCCGELASFLGGTTRRKSCRPNNMLKGRPHDLPLLLRAPKSPSNRPMLLLWALFVL